MRIGDIKKFQDVCEATRVRVIQDEQLQRLGEVLDAVKGQAKSVRSDLPRPSGFFRRDVKRVIVFASPPTGGKNFTIRLTVEHCDPRLIGYDVVRKRKIALPVGRFKRLMREMISRTREQPLDLRGGLSVDQLVYEAMQKAWALWAVRALGKRKGRELVERARNEQR